VNLHAALLGGGGEVRLSFTLPLKARPQAAVTAALERVFLAMEEDPVAVGVTGQGRDLLGSVHGICFANEIIAAALAAGKLAPWARCLVEMGGHLSKWVALSESGDIREHSLNELCAAGSGAFLEQQASRLGVTILELARLAASASSGATVAGRCSVFAKSDMIHLQQKGTPLDEIAYGVCLALARNYAATVLTGRELPRPVALIGGAAANIGLLRALKEVLSLGDTDIVVPERHNVFGAVGAALSAARESPASFTAKTLRTQTARALDTSFFAPAVLAPLTARKDMHPHTEGVPASGRVDGHLFLGVDVGSVSTDFVLLDRDCSVLASVYLPTRGQPIAVMEEALAELGKRAGDTAKVLAAVATGSGRHLAAQFLQADAARNEITAQLRSTLHYVPDVDTIFEIGGQDSKYIAVKNGTLGDFAMNKICAAGTGSFLEEQAANLGLNIIGEFEDTALKSSSPLDLGSRCTVFMETELVHALQRGSPVEDVVAGLAYSIARNYLEKVVVNRPVGETVIFQGGVASNRAVVAAFSQILGNEIRIHPYNRLSGAIGAALIAREMHLTEPFPSTFVGFDGGHEYSLTGFECRDCPNLCRVTRMERGERVAYFGDVCERYTGGRAAAPLDEKSRDLCAVREQVLARCVAAVEPEGAAGSERSVLEKILGRHAPGARPPGPVRDGSRGTIGIPRASISYYELFALWAPMFKRLGYSVIDSGPSTKHLLAPGVRSFSAEACLPVKLAYSHVLELVDRNPDFIFLPSILDLPDLRSPPEICSTCPYTQSLPYMLSCAVNARFLIPQLRLSRELEGIPEGLETLVDTLGVEKRMLRAAYQAGKEAFFAFKATLREKGEEIMASGLEWAAVLIGKPYNIYDSFLNLNLVRHLARMGVTAIPCEFISERGGSALGATWDSLPWRFNRDYVKVATIVRNDARLYPIVVSNFGCGPDGFTIKHMESLLEGKPTLFLEFDEHQGEAGLVTRLEAFADEVAAQSGKRVAPPVSGRSTSGIVAEPRERKFFIPNFADHAYAYAAALRYTGIEAEVLPPPDEAVRRLGERCSSGKECHPYSIIAGDLVRCAASLAEGDPPAVFFFPGTSIPCLLTQYGPGCKLILDQRGEERIEVMTPTGRDLYELLGLQGGIRLWRGLTAIDLLVKASCELRPYETESGSVDAVHHINCRELARAVECGDIVGTAKQCIQRLSSAPIDIESWRRRERPLIGVAGDIYTRTNRFANQSLFTTLEGLGCEVWPAPFLVDIFDFGLKRQLARSLHRRDVLEFLQKAWLIALKELSEQSLRKLFRQQFRHAEEPGYKEILAVAAPYVGALSSEVLILNIAKMVDFATRGADGIINAMCFNCMIGSVSAAMLSKLRRDHNDIPAVNLVFGGTEGARPTLRLEAFIHQARAFAHTRAQ
jgi:predicted CoA-substrate-specific enzyme activase